MQTLKSHEKVPSICFIGAYFTYFVKLVTAKVIGIRKYYRWQIYNTSLSPGLVASEAKGTRPFRQKAEASLRVHQTASTRQAYHERKMASNPGGRRLKRHRGEHSVRPQPENLPWAYKKAHKPRSRSVSVSAASGHSMKNLPWAWQKALKLRGQKPRRQRERSEDKTLAVSVANKSQTTRPNVKSSP